MASKESLAASIPGLSPAARKMLEIAADAEASVAAIANALEEDKSMADRLLLIANSPLFRPVSPLRDIRGAIARLGVRSSVELALAVAILNASGGRMPLPALNVRKQSVAIGAISRIVGYEYGEQGGDNTFLSGVVHDIGLVTLVRNKTVDYRANKPETHDDGLCALEKDAIGYSHADLAGAVLKKWNVGSDIMALATEHHDVDATHANPVAHELLRVADTIEHGVAAGKPTNEILEATERTAKSDSVPPGRLNVLWPRIMEARQSMQAAAVA